MMRATLDIDFGRLMLGHVMDVTIYVLCVW